MPPPRCALPWPCPLPALGGVGIADLGVRRGLGQIRDAGGASDLGFVKTVVLEGVEIGRLLERVFTAEAENQRKETEGRPQKRGEKTRAKLAPVSKTRHQVSECRPAPCASSPACGADGTGVLRSGQGAAPYRQASEWLRWDVRLRLWVPCARTAVVRKRFRRSASSCGGQSPRALRPRST